MLKARLITALILIPIVIAAIFLLPPIGFISLALLIFLFAGWEWANLAGLKKIGSKSLFLLVFGCGLVGSLFASIYLIIGIGIVWWLIAFLLLCFFPKLTQFWWNHPIIKLSIGFLVLMPCWIGLIILQGFSPEILLFCLLLIWSVDSAAYFVGKKWGKHLLAPSISPGKTYEGLVGGLLAVAILSFVFGFFVIGFSLGKLLIFLVICLLGGLVSIFGDLFESMVKRQSQVKDSGALLPGHGGLLDRIDSMTTAVPFFALILPLIFDNFLMP